MIRRILFFMLTAAVLSAVPDAAGQILPVRVETISINDGLSDPYVYCIARDGAGYMWFGTRNGLNRYDGKSVKSYTVTQTSVLADIAPDPRINVLLTTTDDRLLIGTSRGIDIYDRVRDCVAAFEPARAVRSESIRTMIQEGDTLWVGTNNGLFRIDMMTGDHTCFTTENSGLVNNIVRAIHIDGQSLFIGTFDGLSRYDRATLQWKNISLKPEYVTNPKNNLILSIADFPDDSDYLLVGMQTGLCKLDKHMLTHEIYDRTTCREMGNNTVKCMLAADSSVWIGTEEGLMNFCDGHFTNYAYLPNDRRSLPNNIVWSMYRDDRGVLWIGTEGGVAKYDMGAPNFRWVDLSKSSGNGHSNMQIFNAQIDSRGLFWFGSRFGLCRYDPGRDAVSWIDFRDAVSGTYNFVRGLYLDDNDLLWIGTAEGLVCRDTRTGRDIYVNDSLEHCLKYINGICAGEDRTVLVCDVTGKVQIIAFDFNPVTRRLSVLSEELVSLGKDASAVIYDHDCIWMGTVVGGVVRYHMPSGNVTAFTAENPDKHLASNCVTSLFADSSGTLWCCTDKGVERYDVERDCFVPDPERFGNPGYVYAGNADSEGNIWLITRRNVICWESASGNTVYFPTGNWIDTNRCIPSRVVTDSHGNAYVTALDGYLVLNTDDIRYHPTPAPLLLSDVRIAGVSVMESGLNGDVAVENLHCLDIDYTQNSVSFWFSLLDYSFPEVAEYSYFLDGYDLQWRTADGRTPFVEYARLPAGRYRFRVQAISSTGIVGANEIDLDLVVHPAWWVSWWALCLYVLTALTITFVVAYALRRNKRMMEELQAAALERKNLEELNKLKMNFFTNISHDLRTPLSLIISPVESLLEQESDERKAFKLGLIRENAHRLLTLVNQIMDFRKIENRKIELRRKPADLVAMLRRVTLLFAEFAQRKELSFLFESNMQSLVMDFDSDKIEKVFVNLISNAIQYTPAGGSVIVNLQRVDDENVEVMVADNGIGIAAEDMEHIFERFYQSPKTASAGGSGIGLSIVREFIEMHGGRVTVDSRVGVGTTFFVTLAIVNEQPQAATVGPVEEVAGMDGSTLSELPLSAGPVEDDAADSRSWKVLVVDDNEQMLAYLTGELETLYSVLGASSAEEALRIVQREMPDMIVLDVMLPGMNGVEMCRAVKNDPATSHIPIVLLTARTSEEHQIEGFAAGADAYVFKPFSMKVLLSRIDNIIEQRRSYRDALTMNVVNLAPVEVESPDKVFMDRVVEIIERNIDNPDLNLQHICRELAVSHVSFYRKIKAITGFNVSGFIREIRLKKAAQLLQIKNMNVSEVLYSVGFNHKSYFTQCFKARFGMTPREYARKYGK